MTYPITPDPSIHNLPPAVAKQQQRQTTQQIIALGKQMVQAVVKAVLHILTGGILGGSNTDSGTAAGLLGNFFTNLRTLFGVSNGDAMTSDPGSFHPIQEGIALIKGILHIPNLTPGVNLCPNPSFDTDLSSWGLSNTSSGFFNSYDFVWDGTEGFEAPGSAKLVKPDLGSHQWDAFIAFMEGLSAGDKVVMSCRVKAQGVSFSDDGGMYLSPWLFDGGPGGTSTGTPWPYSGSQDHVEIWPIPNGDTDWTWLSGQITVPDDGTDGMYIALQVEGNGSGTFWFDDVSVTLLDNLTPSYLGLGDEIGKIVDAIHNALTGDNLIGMAIAHITAALQQLRSAHGGAANLDEVGHFFTNLLSLFTNPTLTTDPGTFDIGQTLLAGPVKAAQDLLDGFVNFLGGIAGTFHPVSNYQQVAQDTAATIAANAAAVAAMQQQISHGSQTGGTAYFHDFSTDADSASISADFSRTYSGSGSWAFQTSGGKIQWVAGGSGSRDVAIDLLDTVAVTQTDYQLIGTVFTASPGQTYVPDPHWWLPGTTYNGYQWITGRLNAAGDSYVIFFMHGDNTYEFGYVSGGSYTALTSGTIAVGTFSPGPYYLECGNAGSIRNFQVFRGSNKTPIWTYNDGSAVTPLGSGNRRGGCGGHADANVLSSPISAFGLQDNTPAPLLGSTARMYRASTTPLSVGFASGPFFPTSYFDTEDYATSDITRDATNNTFTVSQQGNYTISVGNQRTSSTASSLRVGFAVNGTNKRWGTHTGDGTSELMAAGAWTIPLSANDVVKPTFQMNLDCSFIGDAAGTGTYFEITKVGNL